MNRQKWILLIVVLVLVAGTAGVLLRLKTIQKLGVPGVKCVPIQEGGLRLKVELPQRVQGYTFTPQETAAVVSNTLPKDTSYGQGFYVAPDGFAAQVQVVLMGMDRTSIHNPQFCLQGQGWQIDESASHVEQVPIDRPRTYSLPVMKVVTTESRAVTLNGHTLHRRGLYVYWFVANGEYTALQWKRMWWMARDLMCTGVLQRWAYISYFSVCAPGQEEATFERMKKLIAATVPEFQLTPGPESPKIAGRR